MGSFPSVYNVQIIGKYHVHCIHCFRIYTMTIYTEHSIYKINFILQRIIITYKWIINLNILTLAKRHGISFWWSCISFCLHPSLIFFILYYHRHNLERHSKFQLYIYTSEYITSYTTVAFKIVSPVTILTTISIATMLFLKPPVAQNGIYGDI